MSNAMDEEDFFSRGESLLQSVKKAGADSADVVVVRKHSISSSVRLGKVEKIEDVHHAEFSIRAFVGKRFSTISATESVAIDALAARVVAMAKSSPEDPYEGLADVSLLGKHFHDCDLFDPTVIDVSTLKEEAIKTEEAALSIQGVTNSSGSHASAGSSSFLLMTSHGFSAHYKTSHFSRSVSVIAGHGEDMQRDYDYSFAKHYQDLDSSVTIGKSAGQRAVRRLNPRKMESKKVIVVFEPRQGRSLLEHLAACINGASVVQKTSFLRDMMHKKIMSSSMSVTDDPFRKRGDGSRPFDGEGVIPQKLTVVEDGVLNHWFLSSSVARELNMQTNGRAVRSSSSVFPSYTNLSIEPGEQSPEDLIKGINNGFYVTELIGHGFDMVTGNYSHAASGYWIENGEISFPVSGVSIASNLLDIFLHMTAANDIDRKFSLSVPTLLVEGMILGGT